MLISTTEQNHLLTGVRGGRGDRPEARRRDSSVYELSAFSVNNEVRDTLNLDGTLESSLLDLKICQILNSG